MIHFITSNKNKLAEARDILGIEIEQIELDLPEIQAVEPEKVVLGKIKEAKKILLAIFSLKMRLCI